MHFNAAEYVGPLVIHSSTSNLGFSSLYDTYSSVALSLRSSKGKILLKTLSNPFVKSTVSDLNSVNSLYEFFWTSIKSVSYTHLTLPTNREV